MPAAVARGDVVLTRFPFTDLSGSSVRPALVVSDGLLGNDVILAGISSVIRGTLPPTDVLVEPSHGEFAGTGLRLASVMRLHKIVTVERPMVVRRLGKIGSSLQSEVDRALPQALRL
jgi:mRNA interferase MazF